MGDDISLEILLSINKNDIFRLINEIVDTLLRERAVVDERFPPVSFKTFRDIKGSLDYVKETISKEGGSVYFIYKGFTFNMFYNQEKPYNVVGISCSESYFKKEDKNRYSDYFINFSKAIWNSISTEKIYGIADSEDYVEAFKTNLKTKDMNFIPPPDYWLNFYGAEFVENFGKKKILSSPVYEVEELKGGTLIITSQLPSYLSGVDYKLLNKLREYFGWKNYTIDLSLEEMPQLYGKKFESLDSLKEHLEEDIKKIRKNIPDIKITVFFYRGYNKREPVSSNLENLVSWLRKEKNVYEVTVDKIKNE